MSSLPSDTASKPLPGAWVDRLFARFVAIYGAQKTQSMWAGADMAEVKELWGEQLGRFKAESIAGSLQRLVESGNQWPPTLPEFVELCRQSSVERARTSVALPPPSGKKPDIDFAAALTPKDGDPMRWARVVGSLTAARFLVQGARRDPRLRDILDAHAAKDFAGLGTPIADYLRRSHAVLRDAA